MSTNKLILLLFVGYIAYDAYQKKKIVDTAQKVQKDAQPMIDQAMKLAQDAVASI